jgi:hypothetical protein
MPIDVEGRIENFLSFVSEALDYFEIPKREVKVQIRSDWGGAAIEVFNSTEKEIILGLGLNGWSLHLLDDFHISRKLAWHEICHWKDLLDGWPYFYVHRPRCRKLNYIPADGIFQEKVHRALFPKELTKEDSLGIFSQMLRLISDVSVQRRIARSPVNVDTVIAITKQVGVPLVIGEFTVEELYGRVMSAAMELECVRSSSRLSRTHVRLLTKIEYKQLRKIFRKIPDLKPFFDGLQHLFGEVKFTKNADELYQWTLKAIRLLPPSLIPSIATLYLVPGEGEEQ